MKTILCASLSILLTAGASAAPLPGDSANGKRSENSSIPPDSFPASSAAQ